ncbi:MAG: outer membrane protein assembly factor BamE [Planctomycetota bacterium]|nr:outer membrane protein assembly factor BamE [Planctomycetota bacterium]
MIDSSDQPPADRPDLGLELDEYHHAMRLVLRRRRQALMALAIAAGTLGGFLAIVVESVSGRAWGPPNAASDALAVIVGAFFGFLSALIVPFALERKDLGIALPLVFGPTAGVIVLYAWRFDPLVASLPAMSAVVGLSAVAWLCLPNTLRPIRPARCHRCGYSLEGNATGRCPECGLDWGTYTDPARIPSAGRLIGAVPLTRLIWGAWPGRIIVGSAIILIVGVAVARHTGPRFTYARFDSIEPGMTCEEVRDILGRPDSIESPGPRVQRWLYQSNALFVLYEVVEFRDDRVWCTDTVRW